MRLGCLIMACVLLGGCDQLSYGEAMNAVRDKLIDPDSAKFSDIRQCERKGGVRGWVNSKNQMGGYTGKRQFFYVNGKAGIEGQSEWEYLDLHRECLRR